MMGHLLLYWGLSTIYQVLMLSGSQDAITSTMWESLTPEQEHQSKECLPQTRCVEQVYCRCDALCVLFNDCCLSFSIQTGPKPQEHLYGNCVDTRLSKTSKPYYFMTECPENYRNLATKLKCEQTSTLNAVDQIPVTSKISEIPYFNRFCARCHGVPEEQMALWTVKIACNKTFLDIGSVSMSKFLRDYGNALDCIYKHSPKPTQFGRICVPESIGHCPRSYSGPLNHLCESYQDFIFIKTNGSVFKSYKNVYCLQCDNTALEVTTGGQYTVQCASSHSFDYSTSPKSVGHGLISTFDFSDILLKSRTSREKFDCEENEVDIKIHCATLYCPDQYVPRYGECVHYSGESNVVKLDMMFIITDIIESTTMRNNILMIIKRVWPICFGRFKFENKTLVSDDIEMYNGATHSDNSPCMYVRFEVVLNSLFFIDKSMNTESCMQDFLQYSFFKISKDIEILYTENVNNSICSTNQALIFPPRLLSLPSSSSSAPMINCSTIRVFRRKRTSDDGESDNDMIQFIYHIGSIQVDPSDVNVTKNGSFICLDIFRKKYDVLDKGSLLYDVYSTYISYTCILASVIILIVTLLHYYLVPGLFNQYSVVLFHLVVLMIVSHSVYLISIYLHFCYWAAILKHFLFLSMFMSMSLSLLNITLHICRMKLPTTKRVAIKTFMRNVVPGYISSGSIVMVTALINEFQYPWQQWYGGSSCFLSDAKILFITFAIPIIVCIVFNIFLFCYVMCFFRSINSTLDRTTSFRRNNFFILLKLSSLTGVGWVLGFLAVLTRYMPLVYAFEGMASLQGLFLSFSILNCNTVSRWYEIKCCSQCQRATDVSTINGIPL